MTWDRRGEVTTDHRLPPRAVGGVFHEVACICATRKRRVNVPFQSQMGFKVTQLSGVYHVFLRTRLFLSTHFRSHVSPGRSQCNREVHGLEGLRQVSNNSLSHFTHIYVEYCWRGGKKPKREANFPNSLSARLILTDFKAFLFVIY